MKKLFITLSLLLSVLFVAKGQEDAPFTTIPVVNGKVIFEQFIPIVSAKQNVSIDRRYSQLQSWAKSTFAGIYVGRNRMMSTMLP